jgi:ketosteroid isomerase-like protein
MKRLILLSILFVLIVSACGQTSEAATVADNPESIATQSIVKQYIKSIEGYDADLFTSLLHDEYVFMDYGMGDGPFGKTILSAFAREAMAEPDTNKTEFGSYTITPDGRFAVIEGAYSEPARDGGKWIAAPGYVVLEMKDGKIIAETWYYNGDVLP